MKSITCNKIFIIDAIGKHIDDLEQSYVASSLYQTLSDKISELQQSSIQYASLSCAKVQVRGRNQWDDVLNNIENECIGGARPIIHIVSHGLVNGLQIADKTALGKELIPWSDVYRALTKINIACHNNLFVSMCVCYGFWSMLNLLNRKRIPFCVLLASPDEVSVEEVNCLIPSFYITLLEGLSFSKAKEKFNQVMDRLMRDNVEVQRWYIKQADIEFVKAARNDYERRSTLFRVRQIAKKEFRRLGCRVITEKMIRWFMGVNFRWVPSLYQKMKDDLFMRDLYPEEYKRFDLPATYNKLRHCSLPKEDTGEVLLTIKKYVELKKDEDNNKNT